MTTTHPANQPVCLVTGGSSGVGLAICHRMAAAGYRIALCGRDEDRLQSAALEINTSMGSGGNAFSSVVDIGRAAEAHQFVRGAADKLGRCDVLINNAAFAPCQSIAEMPLDDVCRSLDVNILGVVATVQAAWPIMTSQSKGTIINITSLAAVDPFPGLGIYGSSKAWVESFTEAAAREGKPLGIRVFAIRPGAVETPLLRRLFPDFPEDECLQPSEIADLALQLCGDEFSHLTGQVFEIKK